MATNWTQSGAQAGPPELKFRAARDPATLDWVWAHISNAAFLYDLVNARAFHIGKSKSPDALEIRLI